MPPAPSLANGEVHVHGFAPAVGEVRLARAWSRELFERTGVLRGRVDDAVLVVGELVANAVLHAQPGPVVLALTLSNDAVRVDVDDAGGGDVQLDTHADGVGLRMVDLAADGWDVHVHPGGKTVRAYFSRR